MLGASSVQLHPLRQTLSSLQRFPRRSTQLWIQLKKKEEVCHVFLHQLVVLSAYKTYTLTQLCLTQGDAERERVRDGKKKGVSFWRPANHDEKPLQN